MKIVDTGVNNEVLGEPLLSAAFNITFKGNNGKVIIEESSKFINCNLYIHEDALIKIESFMRRNSYLNISTAEKLV
jgi:hypothetical protein